MVPSLPCRNAEALADYTSALDCCSEEERQAQGQGQGRGQGRALTHHARGLLLMQGGGGGGSPRLLEEALADFDEALELAPSNPAFYRSVWQRRERRGENLQMDDGVALAMICLYTL